jgi:predicted AlkP superfamily pyrophosphatase or phosphodiesterase
MLAQQSSKQASKQVSKQASKRGAAPRPKAIIIIAFDQMRGDYLQTLAPTWGTTGFRRLLREGAYFPQCYFNHASNITAPGHSVHMTGCYPHKTGIVSNDYYDRAAGLELYCVQDTMRKTFGMENPKEWHSPTNLKMPTLGTYLKRQSPTSKVIGVSQKDRAAILLSGHDANGAYWFEYEAGGYTTSDYYFKTLPTWLQDWNTAHPMQSFAGRVWQQNITDPAFYRPDSMDFESLPKGQHTFPYVLPSADSLKQLNARFLLSPFAVEHAFDFAQAVFKREDIGLRGVTDMFCLSISSTDYIGHQFGPDSREILELYPHVDRGLGRFLSFLDSALGAGNYALAITADHGVAPAPEYVKYRYGDSANAGRIKGLDLIEHIELGMNAAFPAVRAPELRAEERVEKWVQYLEPPSLFLTETALVRTQRMGISRAALLDSVRAVMKRFAGMGAVVTFDELRTRKRPTGLHAVSTDVFNLILNDFYPQRTGELMFYPQYHWILGGATSTHGTPHDYDRHVPMIVLNTGVTQGEYAHTVSPADIAPTLARTLGITMDNIDGMPLQAVVKSKPQFKSQFKPKATNVTIKKQR